MTPFNPQLPWSWRHPDWAGAWAKLCGQRLDWADPQACEQRYQAAVSDIEQATIRIAHHLARDPAWKQAVEPTVDWARLEQAGLIDDGASPRTVESWSNEQLLPQMSPWPMEPEPSTKPHLVLLATGAYAPAHEGHVAMIEAAVADARARGSLIREKNLFFKTTD